MTVWPVLALSLLGSPHCAAMCGLIAGAAAPTPRAALWYHGTRLASYLILGAVAGTIGLGADRLGDVVGLTAMATRAAGLALVVTGVLGVLRGLGLFRLGGVDSHRWVARLALRTRAFPPAARAAALGGLTGMLPCGWLLAFAVAAAGTGRPLDGAIAMGLFWTGTVPALVGATLLIKRAAGPLQRRLPLIGAILLIAFGAFTAMRRSPPVLAESGAHVVHGR